MAKLLEEFGVGNVARWEGAEGPEGAWAALLDFSDVVLVERFSAIDDLVSRVLGGGVASARTRSDARASRSGGTPGGT